MTVEKKHTVIDVKGHPGLESAIKNFFASVPLPISRDDCVAMCFTLIYHAGDLWKTAGAAEEAAETGPILCTEENLSILVRTVLQSLHGFGAAKKKGN
jgi:hypothetical protein